MQVTARKNAAGEVTELTAELRSTEALTASTVATGGRLAALNADGTVLRTTTATPTLVDTNTIGWTLTAAQWTALTNGAAIISIAATKDLRASAWSSDQPILGAPTWAITEVRATSSVDLPVEVRQSLTTLSTFLASIPSKAEDTTKLYEVENLALLGTTAASQADDLLSARMHAHPFTEPLTGLDQVRERWYQPLTGTWLTPDPGGYQDSANLYAFAGGDPLNYRDPTGLCGEPNQEPCGFFASAWEGVKETVAEQVQIAVDTTLFLADLRNELGRQRSTQVTVDAADRFIRCSLDHECVMAPLNQPGEDALKFIQASPAERRQIAGRVVGKGIVYGAEGYVVGKLSTGARRQQVATTEPAPPRSRPTAYDTSRLRALGDLVAVNVNDPAASRLAERIGGRPSVKFDKGLANEFDAVSDLYVAQTKPARFKLGSAFREQAKATFESAVKTGRRPYFHFEGPPDPAVLAAIRRYAARYGVEPVIDLTPF